MVFLGGQVRYSEFVKNKCSVILRQKLKSIPKNWLCMILCRWTRIKIKLAFRQNEEKKILTKATLKNNARTYSRWVKKLYGEKCLKLIFLIQSRQRRLRKTRNWLNVKGTVGKSQTSQQKRSYANWQNKDVETCCGSEITSHISEYI